MTRRKAATLFGVVLAALAVWLFLALANGTDRIALGPTITTSPSSGTPVTTNNYNFSNVNSIGKSQGGSPIAYPTPEPLAPISQTVNGYTVILSPVYADANRIVMTYRVQSQYEDLSKITLCHPLQGQEPPCPVSTPVSGGATPLPLPTIEPYEPKLTDDSGRAFLLSRDSYWHDDDLVSAELVFDTQLSPETLPAKLNLHLAMNQAALQIPDRLGGATVRYIKGPFTFDFSLPIDTVRRIADVNQTLTTSRGDKITIGKVIATRNTVRVLWRVDNAPQPQPTRAGVLTGSSYACCLLKLDIGAEPVTFPYSYLYANSQSPDRDQVVDASLIDRPGDWTISTSYFSTYTGNMFFPPIPGPTFHFTMPPSAR